MIFFEGVKQGVGPDHKHELPGNGGFSKRGEDGVPWFAGSAITNATLAHCFRFQKSEPCFAAAFDLNYHS